MRDPELLMIFKVVDCFIVFGLTLNDGLFLHFFIVYLAKFFLYSTLFVNLSIF